MKDFKSLKEVKDALKVLDDLIAKGDFVEDLDLGCTVHAKDYHIPSFMVKELELEGEERGGKLRLTDIEQPDNSGMGEIRKAWDPSRKHTCGVIMASECKHCGRVHIIKVPCKREWCPHCGQEGSLYHKLAFLRTLRYAYQMFENAGAVGYLVITSPLELREKLRDPEALREITRYIRRMLKREGFDYGYYRWHFAGDEGKTWYPHLNILIPGGYMQPEKLERLKELIRKRFGIEIIHYEYAQDLARVIHIAWYVSRPTWNLQDEVSPELFKGFRKMGVWGNKHFEKVDIKEILEKIHVAVKNFLQDELGIEAENEAVKAILAIRNNLCSGCYRPLKWVFLGVSGTIYIGYIKGKLYRLGWSTWVIIPSGGPPWGGPRVIYEA
jgi:hypothetical protein